MFHHNSFDTKKLKQCCKVERLMYWWNRCIYLETHDQTYFAKDSYRSTFAESCKFSLPSIVLGYGFLLFCCEGMPLIAAGGETMGTTPTSERKMDGPSALDFSTVEKRQCFMLLSVLLMLRNDVDALRGPIIDVHVSGDVMVVIRQSHLCRRTIEIRNENYLCEDVIVVINFGATNFPKYYVGCHTTGPWFLIQLSDTVDVFSGLTMADMNINAIRGKLQNSIVAPTEVAPARDSQMFGIKSSIKAYSLNLFLIKRINT